MSLASVRKLFSVFIQPHEGYSSDYPYCITPQQIVGVVINPICQHPLKCYGFSSRG